MSLPGTKLRHFKEPWQENESELLIDRAWPVRASPYRYPLMSYRKKIEVPSDVEF